MARNKYNYVWVSLIILIFGIIFIPRIIDRIRRGEVVERDRMSIQSPDKQLVYITQNGKKRKVPPFALYNQDSILITNDDYKGKVYVVEFFFTTCPTICPIMSRNLVELQEEFREFEEFGLASITINPEFDTPSVLKQYAEEYGVTDMDWHLLTGNRDTIYQLANAGFNIYAAEDLNVPGGFEHSGLFALVDREGYLRSRKDGFGNPLVYYRGTITEAQGTSEEGEQQQISILKEDIRTLLKE